MKHQYEQKNGILYQDGKPIIAMGQSYYPSFHEKKYPVPPEGDRIGEMKRDIHDMVEAGFQFLRVAAIGNVTLENEEIKIDTPFVDEMLKEADEQGIATSVRLQGYVMNLHGYTDYDMRNEKDEPMEYNWAAFMRSSLFHKGIIEDNREASQALARHFDSFPGVVSYQIYNEPHYPYNGIFDYHPATLEAYREWRKEKGLPPEEPPRSKPVSNTSPEAWIQWRLFSMEAMSHFLNSTAGSVKEAAMNKETYSCMTSAPATFWIMQSGINYFDNAEGMDAVGITSYTAQEGADYFSAAYQYDLTESAAMLNGKHAWTIEIDARTHIPARRVCEETYNLLASGHKGIVYYEWRGDYPDKGTPLPDNCGFIFNDHSKTEHYDRSVQMVQFVNRHSTWLASSEKIREGIAILSSDYAFAYADAYVDGAKKNVSNNPVVNQMLETYRQIRRCGYSCGLVEAKHLKENKMGVKVLFVPCMKDRISKEEDVLIKDFIANGGTVYYDRQRSTFEAAVPFGWWDYSVQPLNDVTSEFRSNFETEDVLELSGIQPFVKFSNRRLQAGVLQNSEGYTVVINNISPIHETVKNATVTLNIPATKAMWYTPDVEQELPVENGTVALPDVVEGGLLVLQ